MNIERCRKILKSTETPGTNDANYTADHVREALSFLIREVDRLSAAETVLQKHKHVFGVAWSELRRAIPLAGTSPIGRVMDAAKAVGLPLFVQDRETQGKHLPITSTCNYTISLQKIVDAAGKAGISKGMLRFYFSHALYRAGLSRQVKIIDPVLGDREFTAGFGGARGAYATYENVPDELAREYIGKLEALAAALETEYAIAIGTSSTDCKFVRVHNDKPFNLAAVFNALTGEVTAQRAMDDWEFDEQYILLPNGREFEICANCNASVMDHGCVSCAG